MSLKGMFEQRKIDKTIRAIERHFKNNGAKLPAIGTTPGSFGWPLLTADNLRAIEKARPNWIILEQRFNEGVAEGVVYGLNISAAWDIYMSGLKEVFVGATAKEKEVANIKSRELRLKLEEDFGVVLPERTI